MSIQPVILSGGSGTRLWPASREQYPKQLLPLAGSDTLLQATARRLEGLVGTVVAKTLVVSNEEYRFSIAEQLRQIGQEGRVLLEPAGRNTAPALTLAALAVRDSGVDPVLLVMPADHVIADLAAFQSAILEGERLAETGAFVTFGIVPARPETGYGYIRAGGVVAGAQTGRSLQAFVEKPDAATAARYVDSGEYLWNSGIFMIKASSWLAAIEHFNPAIAQACLAAMEGAKDDGDFIRLDKTAFLAGPSDSIDYAVMERLPAAPQIGEGVVVPLSAGWSDVGAWDALWEVCDKDANGNVVRGEVMLESSENSMVLAGTRLVAGIGLKDLVIVETVDAVMVAHKDRTQDVKKIVARLKAEGRSEAASHRKVFRPWGWYDSIDSGERFQVKRIVVNPGAKLSLQMHHHRAEHWIVVKGTAEVTNGDKVFLLTENQSTYIPLGHTHRLANPGKVPLEIIEVQSGSYLGEDDIVRFEDTYGR
ncbi:mannose-1-phosphate guanylyltransferase/mannose-6-phosphate isomerase [Niveibacterium sp. SC-1]|uniref:mannose-1-phosphate guanylyltransferase/mannose-6-phosphate isomerase n=1 Tax=Niveibacterium sp. SC-1 TaxID=3135646 RepID=UPI00311E7123